MSEIVEGARTELLRSLAVFERWRLDLEAEDTKNAEAGVVNIHTGMPPTPGLMGTHVPLWENEWESDPDDIQLAVKEARALGQIDYAPPEYLGPVPVGPFVCITPAGIAWLRETGNMPRRKDGSPIFPVPTERGGAA